MGRKLWLIVLLIALIGVAVSLCTVFRGCGDPVPSEPPAPSVTSPRPAEPTLPPEEPSSPSEEPSPPSEEARPETPAAEEPTSEFDYDLPLHIVIEDLLEVPERIRGPSPPIEEDEKKDD